MKIKPILLFALIVSPLFAQPKISIVESAALTRDRYLGGRVPLASNGLATIFGTDLADRPYYAAMLPLPQILGDTQVLADGSPVGIIYADPHQINFLMPNGPGPRTFASVTVQVKRASGSDSFSANVFGEAPGIFEVGYDCSTDTRFDDAGTPCGLGSDWHNGSAMTRGAITDQSGRVVDSSNPARMGQYYTIWMTGLGNVPKDFNLGTSDLGITVTDVPVYGYTGSTYIHPPVSFVGNSPQFPGLNQINFRLPEVLMGPGVAGYPPLWPCADYRFEISIQIDSSLASANLVQLPVRIQNGDVACVKP